jgi:hypothetical protein
MKHLFSRWLGRSTASGAHRHITSTAASDPNALDIGAATAAHRLWKQRLLAYLEDPSGEDLHAEQICFDDRCDLGKWLHAPQVIRYRRHPGFKALIDNHRMFHYAAANVVSLAQASKHEEARAMLEHQFESFSTRVLLGLEDLKALSERRLEKRHAAQLVAG